MTLRISIFICLLCAPRLFAAVDQGSDGLGDLWQLKYNAAGLALADDTDGDGQNNGFEAVAGTDPFKAVDVIRITRITRVGNSVQLFWPSIAGKRYQVEYSDDQPADVWIAVGSLLAGNDGELNATIASAVAERYFRVWVSDVDTDTDGVSDWEEIQAGLDPNHSGPGQCQCGTSCECYPTCHCSDNDLDHLNYLLQAPPYVSIVATDADAAEPGSTSAADAGSFLIKRTGGLGAISVALEKSGSTSALDHNAVPAVVPLAFGVNSSALTITPLADALTESDEAVTVAITPSGSYSPGLSSADTLLIHDQTQANGTGLWAEFFNETGALSDTNPPLYNNRIVTRVDVSVNYDWPATNVQGVASPAVGVNVDDFSCRWSGEILPAFSQTYTFEIDVQRACRLWVNGQLVINNWPGNGAGALSGKYTALVDLVGGKRVPIVLEHYDTDGTARCKLYWQSVGQTKEIIPTIRMFPQTAPQILNSPTQIFLQNSGVRSWQISASGNPTNFSLSSAPPGWSIDETSGLLSGPTTTAGIWKFSVTASNAYGSGSAILEINIVATAGSITHETWSGISGAATTATFDWNTAPSSVATLSSGEIADHTLVAAAQRLRGYMTAPETGMYRFWITGDDSAELLISNDAEPINLFSRATLTSATAFQTWAAGATSPILWLEAGHRYYWEARTVNQADAGHLSVGWLLPSQGGADPMASAAPGSVIPSYALSPWLGSTEVAVDGTLYTTQMSGQNGNVTGAYGNATLQVNEAQTQAVLRFNYANLTAPKTAAHIHSSAHGGAIIFDIDTATPQADGSYVWTIVPAGAITVQDIKNLIVNAQAYINIHSATYPAGEISGTFRQQTGSQSFVPPVNPPSWTDDHLDRAAAIRMLNQASYGANEMEILSVQARGYEGWIDDQFLKDASYFHPIVYANRSQTNPGGPTYPGSLTYNAWWQKALTAPDQLRQRIAFALSQIFVISESGPLDDRSDALSDYYDMLLDHSFGNARELLESVSLHPAMGRYLDMLKNERPDKASGRIPNENYAREILQLFSIGLYRMHPDGSLMLDSLGQPVPTYGQEEVIGFAHVFTGWNYNQADAGAYKPTNWSPSSDWLNPMREVPGRHDIGTKRILNNVVLPGLPKITVAASSVNLNPATSYSSNTTVLNDDEFQNLASQEMEAAHDSIFANPNLGPFLCRQLIQRLVTSTPSRAYVYRVSQVFANNGSGVRGDMKAVIKAILLDYEARSSTAANQQGFGKQKEPLIRVTNLARAFPSAPTVAGTYQQTDGFITLTTTTPHRLVSGNWLTMNFTSVNPGSPSAPTSGSYQVTSNMPVTANTFSIRPKEVPNFTYAQSGNLVTATLSNHGFAHGMQVYIIFPPATSVSQLYTVSYVNSSTFTVTVVDSATRTNLTAFAVRHTGAYSMVANSATVNVLCNTRHHLTTGQNVYLDFAFVSGQTYGPTRGLYPVTVIDELNFSIVNSAPAFTVARSGDIVMSPQTPVLSISGQADTGFSHYVMSDTETDLGQTPMRSPTVFNFYMPDYQFPGTLAANGLITPEFQLSSDTNVIRQSNFLYEGIYKPSNTGSIHSGFRSGNGAIALDFTPWIATRPGGSAPWTDNANVAALVDELSILLTAGQLSAAARTVIVNYVSNNANITYPNGSATDVQKINRLRGIIHLIATSPDFTIQR